MKENTPFSRTSASRQPFYKIPLFYILIIAVLAIGFGGGWLMNKKVQKAPLVPRSSSDGPKTSGGLSTPSVTASQGPYSGWSEFSDTSYVYKLSYPTTWALVESSSNQVTISTPDQKFELVFTLAAKDDESSLPPQTLYKGLTIDDSGKITILKTSVIKQKSVEGAKSKQYFYPHGSTKTKDGTYVFSASFEPISTKLLGDIDLENTDYRAIAEKILSSIELK